MEPCLIWEISVAARYLHQFGNSFPGVEAAGMRTDKLGCCWQSLRQSLGWIETSVTVSGEDACPSLPQEVSGGDRSRSAGAGVGVGRAGWDGAVAGLLVGQRPPHPWGREDRHPSPACQSGTGSGAGGKAPLGLAPVRLAGSAERRGCGDSRGARSVRWRLHSSRRFLTRAWTALCHKLKGRILKEALIKS